MSAVTNKCPNCGGPLKWSPKREVNKCDYCLSEFTNEELDEIIAKREKLKKELNKESSQNQEEHLHETSNDEKVGFKEYICDNCGAEVVTTDTTSATYCYYCHSPVILTDRLAGDFKPDAVIPFNITKKDAVQKFLSWAKKYKYTPKGFGSKDHIEKMTGVYIPNWMVKSDAAINLSTIGKEINVWTSGQTEYTQVNEYKIEKQGNIHLDNISDIAIKKMDRELLKSVEPYQMDKLMPYNSGYLNGFFAESYDIKKEELKDKFLSDSKSYTQLLVDRSVSNLSGVDTSSAIESLELKDWKYVLFPCWILTYQFLGKVYLYVVNGQTGKAFGELPFDSKRVIKKGLFIALLIAILLLAGGYFIW